MEETEETKEETKEVSLGEVPTAYGLVFKTPEGEKTQEQYLVWIGNQLLEIKYGIIGKK